MALIKDPVATAAQVCGQYQDCYGSDLLAAVLYGSAGTPDFDPRHSDINLLLIVRQVDFPLLDRSAAIQRAALRQRVSRPLFLDPAYIERSLDTFPVEFLDLQLRHRLLWGQDLLSTLVLRPADLRLQLERELKGKQLHLRQGWLACRDSRRQLRQLVAVSLHDFAPLFRALLHLRQVPVPPARELLLPAVEAQYGLASQPLQAAARAAADGGYQGLLQAFQPYAQAVAVLAETIDHGPA